MLGAGIPPDSVRFRHHQFEGRLLLTALTTVAARRPVTPSSGVDYHLTGGVNAVHLKNRLRDVQPDKAG
jgi:hypothetical protein